MLEVTSLGSESSKNYSLQQEQHGGPQHGTAHPREMPLSSPPASAPWKGQAPARVGVLWLGLARSSRQTGERRLSSLPVLTGCSVPGGARTPGSSLSDSGSLEVSAMRESVQTVLREARISAVMSPGSPSSVSGGDRIIQQEIKQRLQETGMVELIAALLATWNQAFSGRVHRTCCFG
jgi:hypothetical protein